MGAGMVAGIIVGQAAVVVAGLSVGVIVDAAAGERGREVGSIVAGLHTRITTSEWGSRTRPHLPRSFGREATTSMSAVVSRAPRWPVRPRGTAKGWPRDGRPGTPTFAMRPPRYPPRPALRAILQASPPHTKRELSWDSSLGLVFSSSRDSMAYDQSFSSWFMLPV